MDNESPSPRRRPNTSGDPNAHTVFWLGDPALDAIRARRQEAEQAGVGRIELELLEQAEGALDAALTRFESLCRTTRPPSALGARWQERCRPMFEGVHGTVSARVALLEAQHAEHEAAAIAALTDPGPDALIAELRDRECRDAIRTSPEQALAVAHHAEVAEDVETLRAILRAPAGTLDAAGLDAQFVSDLRTRVIARRVGPVLSAARLLGATRDDLAALLRVGESESGMRDDTPGTGGIVRGMDRM